MEGATAPNQQQRTILCHPPHGVELCSTWEAGPTLCRGPGARDAFTWSAERRGTCRIATHSRPRAAPAPAARARRDPCPAASLPSISGLARKTLGPAPRLPNSSNALERPPFVLHSSNQLPAAHRPSAGLTRGATAHLYANYFATWTKVIMPSDRKLTGLKSRMEINKLTPLNGREPARAPRPHLAHLG